MKKRLGIVLVATTVSLVGIRPVAGQGTGIDELAFLVGQWDATGELFGQPATFDMAWEPALGGQFLRLRFANALGKPGDARPVLRSEAVYRPEGDGAWSGTWFDTRGKRLDLSGSVIEDGNALHVRWVDPGVEEGVTVYRRVDADHVQVVDSVMGETGMRLFGSASYARRGGNAPAGEGVAAWTTPSGAAIRFAAPRPGPLSWPASPERASPPSRSSAPAEPARRK